MTDGPYFGPDYRHIKAFIYAEPEDYWEQLELPFDEKEFLDVDEELLDL